MIRARGVVSSMLLLLPAARAPAPAQPPRASLSVRWSSDSSWEGSYLDKPYRFRVRETLEGQLVFELADSALLPRGGAAGADRSVKVIQLNDNGTSAGAALVSARGTTTYGLDVTKEGGDCAIAEQPDTSGVIRAPFVGREEARDEWSTHTPGMALFLFRGGEPVAFAFAPAAVHVESSHRLLCPHPETVRRTGSYRVMVRIGDLVGHSGAAAASGAEHGPWKFQTTRTTLGGWIVSGSFDVVVRQHRPMPGDPSASSGQLTIAKRVTITWDPGTAPTP